MSPPTPLAFRPSAIRSVPAGRVVGNPVGSSTTRATTLTAAQLRACADAYSIAQVDTIAAALTSSIAAKYTLPGSGIPSSDMATAVQTSLGKADAAMPLSGGTFSGPITGTGGIISQRNGLTAQCYELFETYTSGTNYGSLLFKATASGHQIGSSRGTSGNNRAVQLGHFAANGTFTAGLSVATDFVVSVGSFLTLQSGGSFAGVYSSGSNGLWFNSAGGIGIRSGNYGLAVSNRTVWTNGGNNFYNAAIDLSIGRDAAGVLGVYTTESGSTKAGLICGQITITPPASLTLAANGLFSIEMTSNTAGNLVYRGSDGTTRRMALTFT